MKGLPVFYRIPPTLKELSLLKEFTEVIFPLHKNPSTHGVPCNIFSLE